ncbi:CinA family protein [Schlesneria paludicola]|uniref:CinA family protein n=1 Tax=Schlesneria paludicola TaxID=360056 RepID=UPI00029A4800|nr:CinA family protein [Schlesneria paludicola]
MFSPAILQAAAELIRLAVARNIRIAFAESCTGGLITAAMTEVPGASRVVDRGFIVYSFESKEQELGIAKSLFEQFGAVSEPVAIAMAIGALRRAGGHAQLSIAATGVAGPDSSPTKPVGLVHIAVSQSGDDVPVAHEKHEFGPLSRDEVRSKTILAALSLAARCLHA